MRIHLALGAVVLSVGLAGLGGVAVAQTPTTGPDSAACAQASVRVEDAAKAANTAGDNLTAAQTDLKAANDKFQKALDAFIAARRAQDALPDKADPKDVTAADTKVKDTEKAANEALEELIALADPSPLTTEVTKAQAALETAIKARIAACAAPATSTTTPAPTSTVAPTTATSATTAPSSAPASSTTAGTAGTGSGSGADTDYSQVDQAPVGGVETGEL